MNEPPETKGSTEDNSRRDEGDSDVQEKKQSKSDDNVESSSSSSDNGKGSGSGGSGGYNADCSSSDTSSLEKGNIPEKDMQAMSIDGDAEKKMQKKADKARSKNAKKSKAAKAAKSKEDTNRTARETMDTESSQESASSSAVQWNGFRVLHPMDPRIDLSTVAHIQTSAMSTSLPNNVNVPSQPLHLSKQLETQDPVETSWPTIQAPPTADQYLNLMKVKNSDFFLYFDYDSSFLHSCRLFTHFIMHMESVKNTEKNWLRQNQLISQPIRCKAHLI